MSRCTACSVKFIPKDTIVVNEYGIFHTAHYRPESAPDEVSIRNRIMEQLQGGEP